MGTCIYTTVNKCYCITNTLFTEDRRFTIFLMFDFFIFITSGEGPVTNTEEVKVKTSEAKRMLEVWKEQYFEVRAKIEASGRDQRWEFDRKKLFERTDHMAVICQNLYDVAQVSPFSMKYSKA